MRINSLIKYSHGTAQLEFVYIDFFCIFLFLLNEDEKDIKNGRAKARVRKSQSNHPSIDESFKSAAKRRVSVKNGHKMKSGGRTFSFFVEMGGDD